jgi:ABC-2 type transport system ATP-binding protein
MTAMFETVALGKRYGSTWALSDCTLSIPAGKVAGLVGPNGAGKTTFLHLAMGLLAPTTGTIAVLGRTPRSGPAWLAGVGFVAQDSPLYARLTVAQHLRMGAWLNPAWDAALARERVTELGLDLRQRAGTLSGGQQAQLALTLAVAKRPAVLVLDEPIARLDPLAAREFLQGLMEIVAAHGTSVVLSSHQIANLERVCDHLVVLAGGRVALDGDLDQLLAAHCRLTGPRRDHPVLPVDHTVIEASHNDKQTTLVIRTEHAVVDPSWTVTPISLDDLILAYMRRARDGDGTATARLALAR